MISTLRIFSCFLMANSRYWMILVPGKLYDWPRQSNLPSELCFLGKCQKVTLHTRRIRIGLLVFFLKPLRLWFSGDSQTMWEALTVFLEGFLFNYFSLLSLLMIWELWDQVQFTICWQKWVASALVQKALYSVSSQCGISKDLFLLQSLHVLLPRRSG